MTHITFLKGEISNVVKEEVNCYQCIDNFHSVVCYDEFYVINQIDLYIFF